MFGKFPAKRCLCLKNVFSNENLTVVEVTALQFVVYFAGMIHFVGKRITSMFSKRMAGFYAGHSIGNSKSSWAVAVED